MRGPASAGGGANDGPRHPSPLTSAPLPPVGPEDRVRGPDGAPTVVVYANFECPYCAVVELRLRALAVRVCFRHFPVRARHPRAWPAAQAAEAAAAQGAFWEMHDALFDDQGRLDDPHLWARAEALGLDVERFHADARSDAARERVERDFRTGLRVGVVTTPTLFLPDGTRVAAGRTRASGPRFSGSRR